MLSPIFFWNRKHGITNKRLSPTFIDLLKSGKLISDNYYILDKQHSYHKTTLHRKERDPSTTILDLWIILWGIGYEPATCGA